MKPRFPVPVRRFGLLGSGTPELFRADTTVLHLPREIPEQYRVEPVKDRRHTKPKLYRISLLNHWGNKWHPWEDIRPCRLSNLQVSSQCLIEVPLKGVEHVIWRDSRGAHFVRHDDHRRRLLLCEDDSRPNVNLASMGHGLVTCRECLKHNSTWLIYRVLPYEHPRVTEKHRRKDQNKARIRGRYPTAFDRLSGDFLDD